MAKLKSVLLLILLPILLVCLCICCIVCICCGCCMMIMRALHLLPPAPAPQPPPEEAEPQPPSRRRGQALVPGVVPLTSIKPPYALPSVVGMEEGGSFSSSQTNITNV